MNTTVSILFYIKRSKVNTDGNCPIYVRITVQSKRFELSSNKFVNPEKWSIEGTKVKGSNEEARTINGHLGNLKTKILEAEKKLFKKDIIVNSDNLKNELLGVNENRRMLIPIFEEHNNKIKELIPRLGWRKRLACAPTRSRHCTRAQRTDEAFRTFSNLNQASSSKYNCKIKFLKI
jgi:hypothetical protein